MSSKIKCPTCGDTGMIRGEAVCHTCKGTGFTPPSSENTGNPGKNESTPADTPAAEKHNPVPSTEEVHSFRNVSEDFEHGDH